MRWGFEAAQAAWVAGREVARPGMIRVESRPGESLDKTLRRFKKQCEKEGLTKDMKRTAYFEKPSERKRRKVRQAEKSREKAKVKARPAP
ncbi:MAG: hypothetical protein AMXMBFR7_38930 [Planctomycetota bacterium]